MPNPGSVYHPDNPVKTGKARKTVRFGACGNGGTISPRLPKYGWNAPRLKVAKGLYIEVVFALCCTLFIVTFAKGSPVIDVIFSGVNGKMRF